MGDTGPTPPRGAEAAGRSGRGAAPTPQQAQRTQPTTPRGPPCSLMGPQCADSGAGTPAADRDCASSGPARGAVQPGSGGPLESLRRATRAPLGDAERGCGLRAAGSVQGSLDSSAPEGGKQVPVQGPHADLGPSVATAVSSQKSALHLEFILRRAHGSTGAHRERSCHGPTRTPRQESGKWTRALPAGRGPRDTGLLPALPHSEATLTQCLRHLATSSPSVWPMRPFGAGGVREDTALQVLATGRLR